MDLKKDLFGILLELPYPCIGEQVIHMPLAEVVIVESQPGHFHRDDGVNNQMISGFGKAMRIAHGPGETSIFLVKGAGGSPALPDGHILLVDLKLHPPAE